MICNKCGREMSDTDKYCGMCGTLNPMFENTEPAQEHAPYPQTGTEPAQEHTPYPQTNTMPAPEYRPYPQPIGDPNHMAMSEREEKVKHTCSLSAVIFCGIVIFLLSVACGVFAGLYFSVKPAAKSAPSSLTEYADGEGELTW